VERFKKTSGTKSTLKHLFINTLKKTSGTI